MAAADAEADRLAAKYRTALAYGSSEVVAQASIYGLADELVTEMPPAPPALDERALKSRAEQLKVVMRACSMRILPSLPKGHTSLAPPTGVTRWPRSTCDLRLPY